MIRAPSLYDIDYLVYVEKQSFALSDRFTRSQFQYAIKHGKGTMFVYCHVRSFKAKGYIYYFEYKNHIRIYSIALNIACRSKGVGSRFLSIINRHKKNIHIEVRVDNKIAINFYKKHGYKAFGVKHNYYKDGTDALVMKRIFNETEKTRR